MSKDNKSGLGTVSGLTGGLGILAGLGLAAYGLYQHYKEEERQQQSRRSLEYNYPSISTSSSTERHLGVTCAICHRGNTGSEMFLLTCNHQFHSTCLAANYTLKKVEGSDEYGCPICDANVTDAEIDAFTKDFQTN